MKIDLIDALAQRLRNSSIVECEYEEAGHTVRMRFAGNRAHVRAEARTVAAEGRSSQVRSDVRDAIKASAAGVLRYAHPCAASVEMRPGDAVAQGDIVGFLQVGEVLSAVTAHRAGLLGERLLPDGALVGCGEEVMAIS